MGAGSARPLGSGVPMWAVGVLADDAVDWAEGLLPAESMPAAPRTTMSERGLPKETEFNGRMVIPLAV
ncbi:MAG: hypothetical protein ACE5IK_01250 [Acidobacteriota bacterium]